LEKEKRLYLMESHAYERSFGLAPISIEMHIYELDGASKIIFHNYLVEKEGLHNTLLMFPDQHIQDDDQFIFIYKELNDWAEKGIRIQEHDRCPSDIIALNYKDKHIPSAYPWFPKAEDNNIGSKDS
jgi:hypothetical protein